MRIDAAVEKFTKGYRSIHTRKTYACGIRRFCDWCAERGEPVVDVGDLDPGKVLEFVEWMTDNHLSPRTVQSYTTAIGQLMKFANLREWAEISGNDILRLKEEMAIWNDHHKVETLPRLPNEAAVLATLTTAHLVDSEDTRKHLYYLRQCALLETWKSTACRISDSAKLKRVDLNMAKMVAVVRAGKGNRDRTIIWRDKSAWDTLMVYLAERDKLKEDGHRVQGEEPVFARHDYWAWGKQLILPLTTNSMRVAHQELCKRALMEYYKPHSLRHRAITQVVEETGNMAVAQQYAGHKHMSTTEVYTHLATDTIIDIVRGGNDGA